MPAQIPLSLPIDPAMGEDDFLITSCNTDAAAMVKNAGPQFVMMLLGPHGSGKSHLARTWMTRVGAKPLDFLRVTINQLTDAPAWFWEDVDQTLWVPEHEEKTFHLLNSMKELKRGLLITSTIPPAVWPLQLMDLRSRLLALPVAQIAPPDDALVAGLLLKHLNDRQLRVSEDLLHYLIPRLPRDAAQIEEAVRKLDRASLASRRPLSIPFAREALQGMLAIES